MTWIDDRIEAWHKIEDGSAGSLHHHLGMSWDLYKQFVERPPKWILGIDEVGCGCWAGPLVVGGVLAPVGWTHEALRDSKEVKAVEARAKILTQLESSPGARYFLHRTSVESVDAVGIRRARAASFAAICSAVGRLEEDMLIVIDGDLPAPGFEHVLLPKADGFVPHVQAAAMTAKVSRDTEMMLAAKTYPQYSFERHKGYGTAIHEAALEKHGPCPLHRRSFRPVQKYSASSTSAPLESSPPSA